MSTPLTFKFVDSASAGASLIAIILDTQDRIWDPPTRTFRYPPRVPAVEIELRELDGEPGAFVPVDTVLPDLAQDDAVLVRIEAAADATRTPIAAFPVRSPEVGMALDFSDVLEGIVPGSGVDGFEDDRWRTVLVDLLSSGAGGFARGKGGLTVARGMDTDRRRTLTLSLNRIGGGAVRRMVVSHAEPLESYSMPPDAFRAPRPRELSAGTVLPSAGPRPSSVHTDPPPDPPPIVPPDPADLPTLELATSANVGTVPLTVTITATATAGTAPYAYSVNWGEGDGFTGWSDSPQAAHTFLTAGTFTVLLRARDSRGAVSASTPIQVQVVAAPAPPSLTMSVTPEAGAVTFVVTVVGQAAGGTPPYRYSFDSGLPGGFGAFVESSLMVAIYTLPDTYTVRVQAKDALGLLSPIASHQVVAYSAAPPPAPRIDAFTVSPSAGAAPLQVTASLTASQGTAPLTYALDWGEGAGFGAFGASTSALHTYSTAGTYTVRGQVRDSLGTLSTVSTLQVVVAPAPAPTAGLIVTPATGAIPLVVSAALTASGGTGPYDFSVDWGEGGGFGAYSSSTPVGHTYSATGVYTARVRARDALGTISAIATQQVTAVSLPNATLVVAPAAGTVPLAVIATVSVAGGTGPYRYAYDWGSGFSAFGASASDAHTFAAVGTFTVRAKVRDNLGFDSTIVTQQVTVTNVAPPPAPTISLAVSPDIGVAPVLVAATVTAGSGAGPYTYAFDWGTGFGSFGASNSDSRTFSVAATTTVRAQVKDSLGALSPIATHQVTVSVPPTIALQVSPTTGLVPLAATATITAASGVSPYRYSIDFGDGTSPIVFGAAASVAHTYALPGSYTVSAQVQDAVGGRSAIATAVVTAVQAPPTTVSLAVAPDSGDFPLVSNATLTAAGGTPPYNYAIDFGDGVAGSFGSSNSASHTYAAAGTYTVSGQARDATGALSPVTSHVVTVTTPPPPPPPPTDPTYTVVVGSRTRRFLVHRPTPEPAGPLPVVIAMHPEGTSAAFFAQQSGWSAVADLNGFVAVYPEGTPDGALESWDAWVCCGSAAQTGVDDIGFLNAMVDLLPSLFSVDRARVYLTGFSNGGGMAHRMAAVAPARYAAVAAVAGALTSLSPATGAAIPVLHIHGMLDTHQPYAGGPGPDALYPFDCLSVPTQVMPYWATRNGASTTPTVTARTGYDVLAYLGGKPTVLYRLTSVAHVYDSGLFNTSAVIWAFLAPIVTLPQAVLTATPPSGTVPLGVTLSGAGSVNVNGTVTYAFDFGEGAGFGTWQSVPTIAHVYATAGTYLARLKVRDTLGRESAVVDLAITASDPVPLPPEVDTVPRNRHALKPETWSRYPSTDPDIIAASYSLVVIGAGAGTSRVTELETACATAGVPFVAAWYEKATGVHSNLLNPTSELTFGFPALQSADALAVTSCGNGIYSRNTYSNPSWYYIDMAGVCHAGTPALWLANQLDLATAMRARKRLSLYLDNVGVLLSSFTTPGLPAGYSDTSWWNAVVAFVAGMRAGMPADLLVLVNVYVGTSGKDPMDVLPHVDGIFREGASWKDDQTGAPPYFDAARYRDEVDFMRAALRFDGGRIVVMIEDFTEHDFARRIFRLATWLLVWDGSANLKEMPRVHDTTSELDICIEYNSPVTDLGAPHDPLVDDGSVVSRIYDNGLVAVNPDSVSHTFTVPAGSWLSLGLVGGTAPTDATKNVTWTPIVPGPFALSPHTAVVLKRA